MDIVRDDESRSDNGRLHRDLLSVVEVLQQLEDS
ncbi:hypothetical protein C4K38_4335 [Pseudomonas chlororaphis subsp. piscium]|nr:hypothetical protein C4K38_4335 [Pseudomonas chlororaphis subsp. piscium]AZC64610.1 hypothetical protein C4K33_4126 [Pseudomonas chlororaphis subsp. piscium]AZC70850.1 hypothetical protein C4K32_4196 [Pseudomonas chlororaphis subsp. piscium]KZO47984.1 hypothetical protein PCL1391_3847 [Pseudomonas chlororaphis subsp. piscium]SDS68687.1 hypothetical protein SAMN05216585_3057 [Pseudomonas chlororaphis]